MRSAVILALALAPALTHADEGYHPWAPTRNGPTIVDVGALLRGEAIAPAEPTSQPGLPDGWVQQGNVVLPTGVASGELAVDPDVAFAVEDIPGNAYPRKHTMVMNFDGAPLLPGSDNSAEDRSSLASGDPYPAFNGGEQTEAAAVQSAANDLSTYGVRVIHNQRPPKILPYTMVMIGGSWQDTNLDMPAGGVAPGADCGALGQRHVVYVFADGGWGGTGIANVTGQEAGHAWGLDHSVNCNSVMAYCGSGDKWFSNACDGLCEGQCQGAAGCRPTHEMFCGEGSDQQNEDAELTWIFGGNEPDMEPPTAEIVEPADGAEFPPGTSVDVRALVDDDYGGFGWRFEVTKDGEVIYDEVAYKKDVDAQYRAAINLVNLDEGTYTIVVEVMDHGDHVVQDAVTITVQEGAATSVDGTASDGGTDEGGETTTASEGGPLSGEAGDEASEGGVDGSGSGSDGGMLEGGSDDGGPVDKGCGCAWSGPRRLSGTLGMAFLLALGARGARGAGRARRATPAGPRA